MTGPELLTNLVPLIMILVGAGFYKLVFEPMTLTGLRYEYSYLERINSELKREMYRKNKGGAI